MKKIEKLFDKKFVLDYLREKVLPLYPDFTEIKSIEIHAYKKHIWDEAYHVVVGYDVEVVGEDKETEVLPIFCSAHSDEPRKNVYDVLKFLWEHGFGQGNLSIPHPLFFSAEFNGTFYRGAEGKNLYRYIRVSNFEETENIIPKAAFWFAKLHQIPTADAKNFNEINSRIRTVMPGVDHIIDRIKEKHPEHLDFYKKVYKVFLETEENFLASTKKRWLVHGDAHPENVIRMSKEKIAVIDFTDLCLSDFARDLGAFTQQLEFMCKRKIEDKNYAKKVSKLFLDSYFSESQEKLTSELQARIDNYYNWTTIRTATHFLIKHDPEPERAIALIEEVKTRMGL